MYLLRLVKVDLERNNLTVLPENLEHMINCQALNINNNRLVRLPKCVARMPSLTSLSASGNLITYIPHELFTSTSLKILRLSVNGITALHDHVGQMTQLRELCLDFNQLASLPLAMYKLTNLTLLRIEGNEQLLDPSPQVIALGAKGVVKYFCDVFLSDIQIGMRKIIRAVQKVLNAVVDERMADPTLFEPNVILPGSASDRWFAIQLEYFWRSLIPAVNKLWKTQATTLSNKSAETFNSTFSFSEQEVMWAFTNFSDAIGPVFKRY